MKQFRCKKSMMQNLSQQEMMISGGMSLRDMWRYLEMAGKALKTIEKYWPKFKHGFVAGWEAA